MGFTLDKVVPWGRSYEEYVVMFDLSEQEQILRILGCGDGPASFNAELTKRGGAVVSVDPIYAFTTKQIAGRIAETYDTIMQQMHENRAAYIWSKLGSVEELGRVRAAAMDIFLADYEIGKKEGRYIAGELPFLPFQDQQFDLALCSHLLFLYSARFTAQFHLEAIQEMLRVAREVRVFPLLTLDGSRSPHLGFVTEKLTSFGFSVKVNRVPYEFQRGGNEMLRAQPV